MRRWHKSPSTPGRLMAFTRVFFSKSEAYCSSTLSILVPLWMGSRVWGYCSPVVLFLPQQLVPVSGNLGGERSAPCLLLAGYLGISAFLLAIQYLYELTGCQPFKKSQTRKPLVYRCVFITILQASLYLHVNSLRHLLLSQAPFVSLGSSFCLCLLRPFI